MNKQELRVDYQARRNRLSKIEFDISCEKIKTLFLDFLDDISGEVFHVFLPIIEKNEVNTWLIIKELWQRQAIIITPKTNFKNNHLSHHPLTQDTKLIKNKWGVPEPMTEKEVLESEIDVIVIPLLAFDENGYRVGYGKGYYDRFLPNCRVDAVKVGLSLFPPERQIDDMNEFDVPLDVCITPDRLYRFNRV